MRAFCRVVERRSFTAAASELGVSKAGLSKQIAALERRLGVDLLHRTTRRVAPTEAGAAYYAEAQRLISSVDDLERSVSATASLPAGILRVSAPMSFGIAVLAPQVARLLERYPTLRLDLRLDDALVDLVSEAFDVAVRIRAGLADSTSIVRRVGGVEQRLCAAPTYLEARGRPGSLGDLEHHDCLAYGLAEDPTRWSFHSNHRWVAHDFAPRAVLNNSAALLQATIGGAGICSLPSFLADAPLAEGKLEEVLPDLRLEPRQIYIVYPATRHLQPKVRVFVDFVAELLATA